MRIILLCCALFLLGLSDSIGQRLMDLKVRNTTGDSVALASFGGKKILFVVLPASAGHALYAQLDSFLLKHTGAITVIGVFPQEYPVAVSVKAAVKAAWAGKPIVFIDDLNVKKGASQSDLFRWLCSSELNGHYNVDNCDVGDKFFVDEYARLFAVFPGRVPLTEPIMEQVVNTSPRH